MNDDLGDRMKDYEGVESGRRFLPLIPVIARLDGKNFSKFTRGLARPYDVNLSNLMIETTKFLVREANAVCGYTQSDEITLAWWTEDVKSQIYFDARVQKMTSVLAAKCSVYFNRMTPLYLPQKEQAISDRLNDYGPVFDCRVWQVPTLEEGANAFLWRELDATKNSVSMAAQEQYSHAELMNKSGREKQEMLWRKGVNWNDYPAFFKRGTYVQRRVLRSKLTPAEFDSLPPLHNARKNPDMEFERTEYRCLDMPPLTKVVNRAGVIFRGEDPITSA